MDDNNKEIYSFLDFRLNAETDTLWKGGELISLSPKAFELLKILIVQRGEIVSKEEIFETIWKDTYVEEGVLTQNIYTLRNTLGKDENDNHLIENIPRRGYRISVPVLVFDKKTDTFIEGSLEDVSQIKPLNDEQSHTQNSSVQKSATVAFKSRKYLFGILFGIVLLTVLGFVFYSFSDKEKAESDNVSTFGNLEFERLTDKGDVNFLHISPDGNWLAYSNTKGIFLKDIQAKSEVRLKVDNFDDFGFLQFSTDGTSLYFRSPEASYITGDVYQTSRLGGVAKIIAENVWSGFSFSPDGRNISFVRVKPKDNENILIVKDLQTGEEKEIAKRNPPLMFYPRNFPAWSTDGNKLVSVVMTRTEHFAELIVNDLETGKEEKIKTENFQNLEQAVWSADGKSIIASANDGKNFQLWKIQYPSGQATKITNDLNDYLGISISADGKKLLTRQRKYFSNIWVGEGENLDSFVQLTQGTSHNEGLKGLGWLGNEQVIYTANHEKLRDWNLWIVNPSDNSRRQITSDTETQNEYPTISPDGKWIFYSSNRGESADIYRTDISGGKPVQITSDEKRSELFPQISPEGDWLYYIKKDRNSSAVWRKSLLDERDEKITSESELSPANFLSISHDGKYLAFQNITKEIGDQKSKGFFKICVISTANPNDKKFLEIMSSRPIAYFSKDGKALEYIKNTPEGSNIWRQELVGNSERKSILNIKNEWLFYMSRSKNGKKLAVSRGNLIRDAVVLTGIE